MSPDVVSQSPQRRLLEHPLLLGLIFSVLLPLVGGATSVWYAQADTSKDIQAIKEKQAQTDVRVDANKRERIEEFKELRREVVTKQVLDEKWEMVKQIDRRVEQLLRLQLEERR